MSCATRFLRLLRAEKTANGGRCVLVAHDWGGMVAWHTAALYPEVVERLIVMALPHPISWMDNMDLDQARPGCQAFHAMQRLERP